MATNTKTITFDTIQVGDELPSFEIDETQDTINGARLIEDHD